MPAFPSWLDLPQNYLVADWIRLEKGRLIARRLRDNPRIVETARQRISAASGFGAHEEWRKLLSEKNAPEIASILEATGDEGQRLRSSMPFVGEPFITRREVEEIRERAYAG